MSGRHDSDEELPYGLHPPEGARAHELTVGGETLLVLSYPLDEDDGLSDGPLSSAELEVARLAMDGLSNAEIADRRATSVRTVANQMASILQKLNLCSRRQLAARYRRSGLGDS